MKVKHLIVVLTILALALVQSAQSGPISDSYWVKIEKATTEYVVLQAGARPSHREYLVTLNVCKEAEGCEWWEPYAVVVLDRGWWSEPVTIYWEDIDKVAKVGYTARILWDCSPEPGLILLGIVDETVVGQTYLPMIYKEE